MQYIFALAGTRLKGLTAAAKPINARGDKLYCIQCAVELHQRVNNGINEFQNRFCFTVEYISTIMLMDVKFLILGSAALITNKIMLS